MPEGLVLAKPNNSVLANVKVPSVIVQFSGPATLAKFLNIKLAP